MDINPAIKVRSGGYVSLLDPQPDTLLIEDIAHALSHLCRFTGHVRKFYSVAQHSVLVSQQVTREHALHALLHDASEAYTGDFSSPLKTLTVDLHDVEHRLQAAVYKKFGLSEAEPAEVKYADVVMLLTEKRDLMLASRRDTTEWSAFNAYAPRTERIVPWDSSKSRFEFMRAFRALYKEGKPC